MHVEYNQEKQQAGRQAGPYCAEKTKALRSEAPQYINVAHMP